MITHLRRKIKHLFVFRAVLSEKSALRHGNEIIVRHNDVVGQRHANGIQRPPCRLGGGAVIIEGSATPLG